MSRNSETRGNDSGRSEQQIQHREEKIRQYLEAARREVSELGVKGPAMEILRPIKCLIFDVDGTLTDGHLNYTDRGEEFKSFWVNDGLAMKIASRMGFQIALVTGRVTDIVQRRAEDIGATIVRQGIWDKGVEVESITADLGLDRSEILFMGDDIIDIPGMMKAGVGVAVANAAREVLAVADIITRASGGAGAAREIIELVFQAQGSSLFDAFIELK
ncbi:MAG: phenylphosphate carboxylase subunit delta [Candidatus Wallbacteria bacterium HGW-Wallbacteria-1]|jgi:3-deoxy-D-manno-octulosonate 8-phosphate phosphatase (KDO 8-P phosphatase)|uniref:Phenylphosphate carboxylase subunit delta n=1 Tax=Candidatus Wallbacteria bacterium HGW-Wallbacteria-1 TaxID=2013854 RepID=A0A2N1PT22_9BACT|nr:MAG: phenylphosphate carboxylase subunit delta [Candidatus Wallbacteria bacterium HGW-Wallbacteria-1]